MNTPAKVLKIIRADLEDRGMSLAEFANLDPWRAFMLARPHHTMNEVIDRAPVGICLQVQPAGFPCATIAASLHANVAHWGGLVVDEEHQHKGLAVSLYFALVASIFQAWDVEYITSIRRQKTQDKLGNSDIHRLQEQYREKGKRRFSDVWVPGVSHSFGPLPKGFLGLDGDYCYTWSSRAATMVQLSTWLKCRKDNDLCHSAC